MLCNTISKYVIPSHSVDFNKSHECSQTKFLHIAPLRQLLKGSYLNTRQLETLKSQPGDSVSKQLTVLMLS